MRLKLLHLKNARKTLAHPDSDSLIHSNRRNFIRTMGLGALAWNPVSESVNALRLKPFEVEWDHHHITVYRNGKAAWSITEGFFETAPIVQGSEHHNRFLFEVSGLKVTNSSLAFNLTAEIFRESDWIMHIRIPEVNIDKKVCFTDWLDGKAVIDSESNLDACFANSSHLRLHARGSFSMQIDHAWNIFMKGDKTIRSSIGSITSADNVLHISPFTHNQEFLRAIPPHSAALTIPGYSMWPDLISSITFNNSERLTDGECTRLHIISAKTSQKNYQAIWASENNRHLRYTPVEKSPGSFWFDRFLFFSEFRENEQPAFYLGASLPETGQWFPNALGSFQFKNGAGKPAFELFGEGTRVTGQVFEPKLQSFQPVIGNALTLPAYFNNPPAVRIQTSQDITLNTFPQDPPAKKQVTKSNTQINRNVPQLNLNYDDVRFIPKKALKIKILRPEDLMILEFEFHNFKFSNKGQAPYLEPDDTSVKGLVIVYLPSQHTLEQAWFESSKIPVTDNSSVKDIKLPALQIRAKKSRLVYELPAGHPGFPLIMDELLDWSKFDLRVHPRAWIKPENIFEKNVYALPKASPTVKAGAVNNRSGEYQVRLAQKTSGPDRNQIYQADTLEKIIRADKSATLQSNFNVAATKLVDLRVAPIPATSTSIEAPAMMYISPNQLNDFTHKVKLELRSIEGRRQSVVSTQLRTIDSLDASKGEIAELWHTRMGVKLKDNKTSLLSLNKLQTIRVLWADDANADYKVAGVRNAPFLASLDANNRQKLVHQTSNYTLPDKPTAVPVKKLILTSLGAYLDWHVFFRITGDASTYLNIVEWEHLATLGRDHFVKIVEEGYLFPFGHRAAVVKITERKFHRDTRAALNRQRMYIVVLEKEVSYSRNDPNGKFIEFPFNRVRIETLTTPDIDNPEDSTLVKVPSSSGPVKIQKKGTAKKNTTYNFYIKTGGEGFRFNIVVTDKEGHEHQIRMPLVFLENYIARNSTLMAQVCNVYNVNPEFTLIKFNNQNVAFAESFIDSDTAFETDTLLFGGTNYAAKGETDIKFHPVMQSANVFIRQIEELTGVRKPALINLEDDNNPGKVFARVSGAEVDFSGGSDKAGGFITPNMSVTALSKLQGPVGGNLADCKNLVFNAKSYFEALSKFPSAKIFGVIDIFSLVGVKDLKGTFDSLIAKVNQLKAELDDLRIQILTLENQAKETKDLVNDEIKALHTAVGDKVKELMNALKGNIPRMPNFKVYTTDLSFFAEYRWQPELGGTKMNVIPKLLNVNVTDPKTALTITSTLERPFDVAKPSNFSSVARFEKFGIDIVPLLAVNFNYLEFRSGSSAKTDVKVDIDKENPIKFQGLLTFVNNLQSIIPSSGFSGDGPYIDLKPTGVTAGFNISIPNVEVGVCMISNISLGASVNLPFTGAPLTMAFNFCRRENPFMLTISCFGGGGFFRMVTTLKGMQSIEAAFEFGAAISLNIGVASGAVSVMGGFYFKMEIIDGENTTTLSGYIRINGRLSVLGLITVSLEFYLALSPIIEEVKGKDKVTRIEGEATLKVKVEVLFFSKTVTLTVRRTLAGADADPKFAEMIEEDDWKEYCLAFAS